MIPIGSGTITIMKAENGWLVNIPIALSRNVGMSSTEADLRRQAQIMKDEFLKDSVLEGLQNKIEEEDEPVDITSPGVYVFKDFEGVLALLQSKFD